MPAFLRLAFSHCTHSNLVACLLLISIFLTGCGSSDTVIRTARTAAPSPTLVRLPNITPLPTATITPTRTPTLSAEEERKATATLEPSATPQATSTPDSRVLSDEEVAKAVEMLRPLSLSGIFNRDDGVWNIPGYSTGAFEPLMLTVGNNSYPVDVLWVYVTKGNQAFRFPFPVGYTITEGPNANEYFGFNGEWPLYPNWLYISGVDRESYMKKALAGPTAFDKGKTISLITLAGWLYGEAGDPDWSQCELILTRNHNITHPCTIGRELDKAYPGANRAFVRAEYDKLPEGFIPWGWYLQASK